MMNWIEFRLSSSQIRKSVQKIEITSEELAPIVEKDEPHKPKATKTTRSKEKKAITQETPKEEESEQPAQEQAQKQQITPPCRMGSRRKGKELMFAVIEMFYQ